MGTLLTAAAIMFGLGFVLRLVNMQGIPGVLLFFGGIALTIVAITGRLVSVL